MTSLDPMTEINKTQRETSRGGNQAWITSGAHTVKNQEAMVPLTFLYCSNPSLQCLVTRRC